MIRFTCANDTDYTGYLTYGKIFNFFSPFSAHKSQLYPV